MATGNNRGGARTFQQPLPPQGTSPTPPPQEFAPQPVITTEPTVHDDEELRHIGNTYLGDDTKYVEQSNLSALEVMFSEASPSMRSNVGILAFVSLAGSYGAKTYAKRMHKDGEITCATYRMIKEFTMAQPWFCLPLMAAPILDYTNESAVRLPVVAYWLMIGGWFVNTTGHGLSAGIGDERYNKKMCGPASQVFWVCSAAAVFIAMIFNPGKATEVHLD